MEELKAKLIDVCNESGLPLEAVYFIAKDFWRDVQETWESYKKQEAQQHFETMNETDIESVEGEDIANTEDEVPSGKE